MQFLTSLFGENGNTVITTVLALGIVLVLVVLGLWVLKVTMKSTSTLGRGRARRLTIVDQLQVDARRQLLIVRRDDVEHLILSGPDGAFGSAPPSKSATMMSRFPPCAAYASGRNPFSSAS